MTNQSKDIQSKWLTTLPSKWSYGRVKQLFRLRSQQSVPNHGLELLSVYTHIGVRPRKDLEQRGNKASNTNGYWIVNKGDLISNKLLAWMGAVGVSHYEGVTSPAYDVLYPIQACNTDYYHYLFRTSLYLQKFKSRSRGIMDMRLRLYFDQFGQILVPIPPLEVQNNIANYLNLKTIQINKLIQKKKRLIKLLKEQKQAIINQAVTRGLDRKIRLKPSGVEFIGNIPEHWDLGRLKDFARIKNGQDHKRVEVTQGYPVIGSGGPFSFSSKFLHNGESVLFGRKGTIDKPIYINGPFWTIDTMFYTEINNSLFAKFLYYCAQGFQFKYYSTQTALPSMTQQDLGKHPLQLPPLDEQHRIVLFLEKETTIYDEAINKFQNLIKLIEEYRTRLISDVVTGQIDVRNIEIVDIVEEELIEDILEEEQEEESLELIGASDDD